MLIQNKEHLTTQGLNKFRAIKASMNNGLSDELEVFFKGITPVQRPNVLDSHIKNPNWLAGFTNGEGCFFVSIKNSSTTKLGKAVQLVFQLTQHKRDELLLIYFTKFFDSGNVFKNGDYYVFKVTKFSELDEKIVPFFKNYPILGAKSKDFHDWLEVFCLFFFSTSFIYKWLEKKRWKIKLILQNKG